MNKQQQTEEWMRCLSFALWLGKRVQLSHHQSVLSFVHSVSLLDQTGRTPQRYWTQCQTFISIQTPDNVWSYVAGKLYGQANISDPFILICCQTSVLLIWQKCVYLESVEQSANESCVCDCEPRERAGLICALQTWGRDTYTV